MFDYLGSETNELSFRKGDVITVLKKYDSDWWKGKLPNGARYSLYHPLFIFTRGFFPKTFVEEITSPRRKLAQILQVTEAVAVLTLFQDFEPEGPNELELTEGEVVTVLEQLESGWWKGQLNGKVGFFPSSFCQLIN